MPFSLYLLERRREQGRLTVTFEASSNVSIFLKPHSTPVGAYERVADRIKGHARKAMSCRGPLRLAGASRCSLKAFFVGFGVQESCCKRSALQSLLHPAALLHEKLPLVSFLALGPPLKNALIRETSIQARCCTVHADSDFQSALFEDSVQFAELMMTRQRLA